MKSNDTFEALAARLRGLMAGSEERPLPERFNTLALELFALQYAHNHPYQTFCRARKVEPERVTRWEEIPAVPTAAFKELELTSLAPGARTTVFHSSGTTEQRRSRHFHSAESLKIYEAALLPWYRAHLVPDSGVGGPPFHVFLTPPETQAPNSSLVHMFKVVRTAFASADSCFVGRMAADGAWEVNVPETLLVLRRAIAERRPVVVLGTAFSFVHLLDALATQENALQLPRGSRVLETGGYKGRSRVLPKEELHALIEARLGIPLDAIICEFGMSELSSQAYDRVMGVKSGRRRFQFPPWARVQIISPETGKAVATGETGLIRIFDLANVWSVMAIQTEDLGVVCDDGFKLVGRAVAAEPRGCSLMAAGE